MKAAITLITVLCVLLAGCRALTEPAGAEAATAKPNASGPNTTEPFPRPVKPLQKDDLLNAAPIYLRTGQTDSDRASIVKTLSGDGVVQIDIVAELCAVVLEPSTGSSIEAVFSFPKAAKPNYDNHFQLGMTRDGGAVSISTDYENERWDTAFEPISGFDGNRYRQTAVLTVRLPEAQYEQVSLRLVTAGETLSISGVDALALEIRIGTGDVVIHTDRAYPSLSVQHVVGNVTLCLPELGEHLFVSSKIGVFTLSLPAEPDNFGLDIQYDRDAVKAGDEAIYVLPPSWNASVSEHSVRYNCGNADKRIVVDNQRYGIFAVEIDGSAAGEPASARKLRQQAKHNETTWVFGENPGCSIFC